MTIASINSISLSGPSAFYNQSNYDIIAQNELSQETALPINYTYTTEHKIIRIAKKIFSCILFPIILYKFIHSLLGMSLIHASIPNFLPLFLQRLLPTAITMEHKTTEQLATQRTQLFSNHAWKYKRFTIEVDGNLVDAMIVGKEDTLENGTWLIGSNGIGGYYENRLQDHHDFKRILTSFNANGIVFNYQGVGASTGVPNRASLAKAYKAILEVLADPEGIQARKIIGYGHSLGAAVQADALSSYELKPDIQYAFIKSRTFSCLSVLVQAKTNCWLLGIIAKIFGWNINVAESSKNLYAPEVILQSANVQSYQVLSRDESTPYSSDVLLETDGLILKNTSLAQVLLDDANYNSANKCAIGIPELHNDGLGYPDFIAHSLNTLESN